MLTKHGFHSNYFIIIRIMWCNPSVISPTSTSIHHVCDVFNRYCCVHAERKYVPVSCQTPLCFKTNDANSRTLWFLCIGNIHEIIDNGLLIIFETNLPILLRFYKYSINRLQFAQKGRHHHNHILQ